MLKPQPSASTSSIFRFLLYFLLGCIGPGFLLGLLLGGIGQYTRDSGLWTTLMMYIPLMPLGLCAIAFDVAARGRGLPRLRYGLCVAAALAIAWSAWWECGHGAGALPPDADAFTIVQWNVWFGGGDTRTLYSWDSISDQIRTASPDLIVLNEAPPDLWLDELMLRMGDGWRWTGRETWTKDWYRCQLALCSPWPMHLENEVDLANGHGMIVSLTVHDRPLRVFVVDGRSDITGPRSPLLHDILRTCERARRDGRPIDIITGDFNTISRTRGFKSFNTDYALASRASLPGTWRCTWPMPIPLLDIDHVWAARNRLAVADDHFLNDPNSDHRGQAARLRWTH